MAGARKHSVIDDLKRAKWMGPEVNIARNEVGQLNALITGLEALEDVGEVWDTIMCLRDEQRKAEVKLADLQYWLTVAEEEIKEKQNHADEPLTVPLDGLHFDDKLQFVEEPIEITYHEVKRLKRSRIPLVKVRWNSKRGHEFTWECEDQFRKKYSHLFTKTAPSSSAV
ncbi:hypothetical protein Tco_1138065 [Tanacetum coccineum]